MSWDGQVYITGSYNWGKYDDNINDALVYNKSTLPTRFGNEEQKFYVWLKGGTEDAEGVDGVKQSNFHNLKTVLLPDAYTLENYPEVMAQVPVLTESEKQMFVPFSELYEDYDYSYNLRTSARRKPITAGTEGYIVTQSSDPSVVTAEIATTDAGLGVLIKSVGVGQANVAIRNTQTGYSFMITITVTEVSREVGTAVAVPMVTSGKDFTVALKANGTVGAGGTWGR